LRFYLDKSEEEEKTSSPSKEAKRMAPRRSNKLILAMVLININGVNIHVLHYI